MRRSWQAVMGLSSLVWIAACGAPEPVNPAPASEPNVGVASEALMSLLPGVAGGGAFAGELRVGAGGSLQLNTGPLYPVGINGCSTQPGAQTVNAASLQLGGFATAGSLVDTVTVQHTQTMVSADASSTVQDVNILTGLITAVAIHAEASSQMTATSGSSANLSTFANLVVNGTAIAANVAPNTVILLPGLGRVTLNEQRISAAGSNPTTIRVIGIHVQVSASNGLGVPVGTEIIIASADTAAALTAGPNLVGGAAYGVKAMGLAGPATVTVGPLALTGINCLGGNNTVTLASSSIPGVGTTAVMTDTVSGTIGATSSNAHAEAHVHGIDLFGGLVHGDEVDVVADATLPGSASGGATFVNATVLGLPVSSNPAPNTQMALLGIGTITFNEQVGRSGPAGNYITVFGIDIRVSVMNPFAPVGARVIIGSANASTHSQ